MNLSQNDVRKIRARVEKALKAEFGDEISADLGNIRYSGNNVKFTGINLTVKGEGESDEDAARTAWTNNCWREGLKPEDFGKVIEYNFRKVKLTSIHSRRKKYSIGATPVGTDSEILLDRKAVARILGHTTF